MSISIKFQIACLCSKNTALTVMKFNIIKSSNLVHNITQLYQRTLQFSIQIWTNLKTIINSIYDRSSKQIYILVSSSHRPLHSTINILINQALFISKGLHNSYQLSQCKYNQSCSFRYNTNQNTYLQKRSSHFQCNGKFTRQLLS